VTRQGQGGRIRPLPCRRREGLHGRPGVPAPTEAIARAESAAAENSTERAARPRAVRELRRLGYEGWKAAHGYGRRWAVEGTFPAVKGIFGEGVRARRRDRTFQEVRTKFALYNRLLRLGS